MQRVARATTGWDLISRFSFTFLLILNFTDMMLDMIEKLENYPRPPRQLLSRPSRQLEFTFYLLVIARIAPINKRIDMNLNLTCEPTLSYDKGIAFS